MRLIDGVVYLEQAQVVLCGIANNEYLNKVKCTGNKSWHIIDDPLDKRKNLIQYDTLKESHKEKVKERFGDPLQYIALRPILNMVEQDAKANQFYLAYKYDNDIHLPRRTVTKYTRAASWLNLFVLVQTDKEFLKSNIALSKTDFYKFAGQLIAIEKSNGKHKQYKGIMEVPGNFPATYQRILTKVRSYQEGGYESIIDPMLGNKKAAKLGKTESGFDEEREREQIAVIRHIASKHNNLDAAQVKRFADAVFKQKGWETVSRRRIHSIMADNKALLTPGRKGRREDNSKMAMQNKRSAPKFPTYYWTLDGWTVELLYQNSSRYDNRLVLVIVLDPMNKYPVGYAIGDRENAALIKEANRNALLHIRELFGDNYYPHQLQSDRYQLKHMTPFYQAVGHIHTPAAVGNAKSKVIEPYFRYLNKQYCQPMPNWSGFNVDAKKGNQVNREMLDMIKKSFPDKTGVVKQIEAFIAHERSIKVDEYKARWSAMPEEDKLIMSRTDWLMVFGDSIGRTNRIEGQGIIKTINGTTYTYDTFDPQFRKHQNIDWQIIVDVDDLSTVLAVSPDGKLRYVLEQKLEVPMDAKSTNAEHIAYRTKINDYNKAQEERIKETYRDDYNTTQEVVKSIPLAIDDQDEAALKLLLTYGGQQKERVQDAKGLRQEEKKIAKAKKAETDEWHSIQEQYLDNQTDYSKYVD